MPSFLTHNFSELPEEFYTPQDWQGFNNPKIVIEKALDILSTTTPRHS